MGYISLAGFAPQYTIPVVSGMEIIHRVCLAMAHRMSLHLADNSVAVIILAAGRGTRMGAKLKLLLPLPDGQPLLRHVVLGALAFHPSEIIVVVRPDLPQLAEVIDDLPARCVPNSRFMEGMGTSLATGVSALGTGIDAVLVMLGDQPGLSSQIVIRLLAAYLEHRKPVTMPRYGTQPGPPTLFARSLFPALLRLEGDAGGKQLVSKQPELVCFVPFRETEQAPDLDTWDDYMAHS